MSTATNVRQLHTPTGKEIAENMPNSYQEWWQRWFVPRQEVQMVATQSKGVFLPYPLLAILVTVGTLLLGGIVTLEVQLNNLSTTILLRDADQRAATRALQEKQEQLEVYIHDMREKRVLDRADIEALKDAKRRQ